MIEVHKFIIIMLTMSVMHAQTEEHTTQYVSDVMYVYNMKITASIPGRGIHMHIYI